MLKQCGNFRDMSLQLYGNECFLKFRKFGNKTFMNLPIPEKKTIRSEDSSDSSDQKDYKRNTEEVKDKEEVQNEEV